MKPTYGSHHRRFFEWLSQQQDRKDPIGNLARVVLEASNEDSLKNGEEYWDRAWSEYYHHQPPPTRNLGNDASL
jgi:hypothetical protein